MLRKLMTVVVLTLVIVAVTGCRKKPAKTETTAKVEVKSQADYNEMAQKDINSENMQAELDKLEKEIQKESTGGF